MSHVALEGIPGDFILFYYHYYYLQTQILPLFLHRCFLFMIPLDLAGVDFMSSFCLMYLLFHMVINGSYDVLWIFYCLCVIWSSFFFLASLPGDGM